MTCHTNFQQKYSLPIRVVDITPDLLSDDPTQSVLCPSYIFGEDGEEEGDENPREDSL